MLDTGGSGNSAMYVMVTKAIEPGVTGSGFYREPSLLFTESTEPANGSGISKFERQKVDE